ncbi:MAG: intradiol ring-cleavage dioxygenase [Bacteroidota bacterium]
MDHDDLPIGRLLSRREVLALLGTGSAALLVGCGTSTAESAAASPSVTSAPGSPCLVKPEQTEGPFFFEDDLFRRDIRMDTASGAMSAGVPLTLTIGVSRVAEAECLPLQGALVDIWHCDADGAYSGYASEGTEGRNFLRGVQRTDAAGEASFLTVYPGWYRGRAVHIHLKVRTSEDADAYEFTSQLYFPDDLSRTVFEQAPYAREGTRVSNDRDGIYRRGGGADLLLAPVPDGDGYTARFDFGLDLSDAATGASDRFG